MKPLINTLVAVGLLAASGVASVCYVWSDGCGDLEVCSGSGWTNDGTCTKDYCEDGLTCLKAGGGTAYQNIRRTRDKKKKQEGGGWIWCMSSTYTQTYPGCCDCDGTWYASEPT